MIPGGPEDHTSTVPFCSWVTVTDSGQWKSDSAASHRDTNRGMGLTLMNAFADRVSTDRTPTGTRINLAFELAATAVA